MPRHSPGPTGRPHDSPGQRPGSLEARNATNGRAHNAPSIGGPPRPNRSAVARDDQAQRLYHGRCSPPRHRCICRNTPCSSMTLDPEIRRQLETFHVTYDLNDSAHRTVLECLEFEPPRPAVEAASRSRSWAKLTSRPMLPMADYQAAIDDLISRDLLWEIDADRQASIADYLAASPALGPTDRLPDVGTLEISVHLANLMDDFWSNVDAERPGVTWSRDWQTDKRHLIYSPTHKGCFNFLREELTVDDELLDANPPTDLQWLSGPSPCGPWRCQWWRKYESGFVLEVHYRS
jgi:hypothetical protein